VVEKDACPAFAMIAIGSTPLRASVVMPVTRRSWQGRNLSVRSVSFGHSRPARLKARFRVGLYFEAM
jgi:hypothetical protein